MKNQHYVLRTLITIFVTMAACVLLLTVTALIPRSMIQKQSEVSARYFADRLPFPSLIGHYVNSIQDNYSDTVICDIIYCIDSAHPFRSVISAEFVQGDYENAYEGYYRAVFDDAKTNTEYGRYWHGSMVFLRLLLMVMPIGTIRLLYGVLCVAIQFAIAAILFKGGKRSLAICSLLGLLLVEPHMFFVSLEYSNIFLVASIAELFVLLLIKRNEKLICSENDVNVIASKDRVYMNLLPFFAAIGVITFFMDFLTTETLTFTLPMLLVIAFYADGNEGNLSPYLASENKGLKKGKGKTVARSLTDNNNIIKRGCFLVIKSGLAWFAGYAGMFCLKIIMLFFVSGREVVRSSFDEGLLRMGGEVKISNFVESDTVDPFAKLAGAIWHNLACLYPVKAGEIKAASAYIPTLIVLLLGIAIVYLLHEKINWELFAPLGIIALIPFARFLVLSNHSYIHFFFSYRALMVAIVVFLLFAYENGIRHLFTRN